MDDVSDKMAFLQQSIQKSKKVLQAVETKNYRTGNIDQSKILAPANLNEMAPQQMVIPQQSLQPTQSTGINMNNLNKSKMPREIIESFKANPPQQGLNNQLGLNFLDDLSKNNPIVEQQEQPINRQPQYQQTAPLPQPQYQMGGGMNELQLEGLKSILQKLIRETVEAVLSEREQLMENATIDENIQIKIGESIFGGKITKVKSIKK